MTWINLIFWMILCQIPAWASSRVVQANMGWYHSLQHPAFSPPDWLFGGVWAVLYVLLALAAFCLTRRGIQASNRRAVWLFVLQLAVNAVWAPVFFGMHWLLLALVLVSVMVLLTVWLIRAAGPISRAAVWLLLPYLAWICFAWLLTASVWWMN